MTYRAYSGYRFDCVIGVALSLFASPAVASQSAKLVYARAADAAVCGEESALRHAVARRLGYDPFVAVSDNTVVAELRGEGEGLRARVFVIERGNTVGGARELTSKTKNCDELMLAVALAISIAIDPESIDRIVEAAPEAEPEAKAIEVTPDPPPLPQTMPPTHEPVPTSAPVVAPLIWRFGAAGFLATGPTPWPAFGIAGSFELGSRRWSIGLEPRWLAPSKTEPQSGTGARASTWMVGVTLVPCYRIDAWRGCYVAELGRLDSIGVVETPKRDVSVWAAQGLRLAYHLGGERGLGATAKLDGLVELNRVTLLLNARPVHETPPVLGRLGIELNYAF